MERLRLPGRASERLIRRDSGGCVRPDERHVSRSVFARWDVDPGSGCHDPPPHGRGARCFGPPFFRCALLCLLFPGCSLGSAGGRCTGLWKRDVLLKSPCEPPTAGSIPLALCHRKMLTADIGPACKAGSMPNKSAPMRKSFWRGLWQQVSSVESPETFWSRKGAPPERNPLRCSAISQASREL